ncbi:MAG: D-2-hydroxyacid dehydrogenase [Isosphaeraceae bacterium]
MKIVVLDGRPLSAEREAWAGLDRLGEVEVHEFTAPEDVPARAEGATVLVTNKAPIGPAVIDHSETLRFITLAATGYDCVDVAAARRRGIPVSNVPEYSTDSVAQFVFALLLELCHHVARHDRAVRDGEWSSQPDFSLRKTPLIELAGKTMGIVGFGRIGRRVGELAEAFGMSVIAYSPSRRSPAGARPVAWCELDELFERADVISLHSPLTPQNVGLVNRDRLMRLKPNALLINTARGKLIVEEDLAEALAAGRLAGAAVDVVSVEPIRPENPLLGQPRCLITPHIAWATEEARQRLMDATVANIARFLEGRPVNVVNGPFEGTPAAPPPRAV